MSAVLQPPKPGIEGGIEVTRTLSGQAAFEQDGLLTPAALAFLAGLHRRFEGERQARLQARVRRQAEFDAGALPDFRTDTAAIRNGNWTVAPIPAALQDRRVEITGPVDPKMVINALNSGANCYMADFEDSTAPTWANLLAGQQALREAIAGTLAFTGDNGKQYALRPEAEQAVLIVRPRGDERALVAALTALPEAELVQHDAVWRVGQRVQRLGQVGDGGLVEPADGLVDQRQRRAAACAHRLRRCARRGTAAAGAVHRQTDGFGQHGQHIGAENAGAAVH